MRHPFRLLALLLTLAIVAAACGSSDEPSIAQSGDAAVPTSTTGEAGDDGGEPDGDNAKSRTITDGAGNDVEIVGTPRSIISLSPTATEMLFAIGAGGQVVAVDEFSNFPADTPTTGLSGFDPNIEAILGFEPDLVVMSSDRNDVVAGLTDAAVPTLIMPSANDFDEIYAQIGIFGDVTGHVAAADALVETMQDDIAELIGNVPDRDEALTYYHELDDTLYSVTSSTFIGAVYALFGLDNVADAADPDGESFGFPQLSAEFLLEADPDLVFLACTKFCDTDAASFAARDGFDVLTAVETGNIAELDDDVVSRWGPRIVDFAAAIAALIATVDA